MVMFNFPDVGEGIAEGEVVEWLVKVGDTVSEDQNIVKIETDKAVVDLPSPASGKVVKIFKKAGEVVKVGEALVQIGGKAEEAAPVKAEVAQVKEAPVEKVAPVKTVPKKKSAGSVVGELEVSEDEIAAQAEVKVAKKIAGKKVEAMPAVRKLAKELGVDLSRIAGTGPRGRVLAKDLKGAMGGTSAPVAKAKIVVKKKYDMWGYVDRIPLKGVRKKIAENMTIQARIPTVVHMDEIDVTRLYDLRKREKNKVPEGVKLTYLPFIMKALTVAAKKYPIVNSVFEGDEIIVKKYYNFGVAVATDNGLIVPVVKRVDQKTIIQLAKEIKTLAEKTRDRTVDLMDLQGGSFTITNIGSLGGMYATPIINVGESSILALGRMYDKVVPMGGRIKTMKVRKMLPVSLAFDHRVYDGAHAALFVNQLKEYLEDPDFLLLDLV